MGGDYWCRKLNEIGESFDNIDPEIFPCNLLCFIPLVEFNDSHTWTSFALGTAQKIESKKVKSLSDNKLPH